MTDNPQSDTSDPEEISDELDNWLRWIYGPDNQGQEPQENDDD